MASYVDSVMGSGEQVLYGATIALATYWVSFLLGGLLLLSGVIGVFAAPTSGPSLFLLILGAVLVGKPFLDRAVTELVITNRRIIAKFGLLKRQTIEMNLSKIESIRVEQGLLGRMLDFGDIVVVGTGGSREPIPRISHPLEFRRRYDTILAGQSPKAA
jgi:uncharacterized membrane protein YdbT with pleckstrin-like domain